MLSRYKEPSGKRLDRLKELIVYIAERCKDDPRFGAIKLNKILYYADTGAYLRLGKPITEATYQHLPEGPAPRELLIAQRELLDDGAVGQEQRVYYNHVQKPLVARRGPDLSHFDQSELDIVDEVIKDLWNMNGKEASDRTHQEWGWRLTADGDEIPYRMSWLSPEPLTQEQLEIGLDLWEELQGAGTGG